MLRKIIATGLVTGFSAIAVFTATPTFAATASSQSCVDGTNRSNLSASLVSRGVVSIGTKNNQPLCENLTLNLSSYTLPDNYNGQGFKNNATAIPQAQYANTVVTLGKGTTKAVTVKVPTPEACKATQVDLYYGKNQTEITTSEGLVGTDAIVGKIYDGTGTCVTTTSTTKMTTTTPPAETPAPEPTTTTTTVAQTPTALPSTGASPILGAIGAATVAAGTYGGARLYQARTRR